MRGDDLLKKGSVQQAFLFLAIGLFVFVVGVQLLVSGEGFPGHQTLKLLLESKLVKVAGLPSDGPAGPLREKTFIYVLGGSQDGLKDKLKVAADLYHRGEAGKVFIYNERKVSVYSSLIGKRLTLGEWSFQELMRLGIPEKDIEFAQIEEGFFGTFSEAKGISEIASRMGYKRLVLVTSSVHTMRTWLSFSKFMNRPDSELYVYIANDHVYLDDLFREYLKLIIYKSFLI